MVVDEAGLHVNDVAVRCADFACAFDLLLGSDVASLLQCKVHPAVLSRGRAKRRTRSGTRGFLRQLDAAICVM